MDIQTAQEIWEAALGELQIQVSKPNYRTWFEKTVGISYQDNQFIVGVPSTFVTEYLDKNQRSLIEKALIGFTSTDVRVSFQVNGRHYDKQNTGDPPQTITAISSYAKFNLRYSFDTFVEGTSNRFARTAALAVVQNPGRGYNPLFIYGDVGLGKTHLLYAIGQAALANHVLVTCASAEQFTSDFVKAIREKNTEEFRNRYQSAGILLIDDIPFISGKTQTEESFFHIFNDLHNNNCQIVVTSNRPPKALTLMDERLRSRFEGGLVVDIQPPDFETRLAILKAKVANNEVKIDPTVLDLIAARIQGNIRELEGALNRVVAYAKLLKIVPNVELASRALQDIATKAPSTSATPSAIIAVVADNFQLSPAELKGPKRDKETTLARRVAMYLIRQETNCSLAQIGQELGGRDATAVSNACKKVASDILTSSYLKRKTTDILQKIHPG